MKTLIQNFTMLKYTAIVLLIITVVLVTAVYGNITENDIATTLLALLATFFGAMFAFRLNQYRDEEALHRAQRQALRRAMFVVARQANAIGSLQREILKFPVGPLRAFNLPALQPPPYKDLTYNFEELEFLLDSNDPNLLMELSVEQETFFQALASLQIRNTFYVEEVQPAFAKLQLNGQTTSSEELEDALGERLFHTSMNSVKFASELIDSSASNLPRVQTKLFNVAKELYPTHKFIKYMPNETSIH